ncbi:serine hydrolase domain-containing protein [Planctobacterium marinum]|uniref:Beta-lactamase-related domain-containing protein n=1 Tax=Planctobacterium marinum TaxID=1631968 RepID=A0AA48HNI3_9ALTE|nr:hypothetical protein MACH26_40050 [Planctobacterium marinum]
MHKVLFILFNLLFLSNSLLAAGVGKYSLDPEHVSQLKSDLKASQFSGFVTVADKNSILLQEAFGLANVESQTLFNKSTQIDIGSISKTFTGLAVAKLIDAGKLNPDDTLSLYFADVPKDKASVTIHQLLTHSAGFPGAVGDDYDYVTQTQFIDLALSATLLFKPGSGYEYSNVGFSLVTAIISKITQQNYEAWLQDLVIKPLKLQKTGYARVYDPQIAESNMDGDILAQASWGGTKPGWHLIGNGGMISTAADLVQMGRMILQKPNQTMLQPYVQETGGISHYGYGIVMEQDPVLGKMHWHNGGNNYFYTDFYTLPEQGLVVILHSNNPMTQSGATGRLLATLRGKPLPPVSDVTTLPTIPLDSKTGKLALGFLDAVKQKKSDAWQALLNRSAHPAFLAMAPMEEHVQTHTMLHEEFKAHEFLSFRELQADNGGIAELVIKTKPNNATYTLSVHYKYVDEEPVLTGIGIE